MPSETRNLETSYFDSGRGFVGRTERVRGDFDAYDGAFETVSVKWWLDTEGHRIDTTLEQIGELVKCNSHCDADGLARFFADTHNLGRVLAKNYTQFIDFDKSFGRTETEIFPRISDYTLDFTTSQPVRTANMKIINFIDIAVNLQKLEIAKKILWSGNRTELKLNSS